jgi:hypothetical protein
MFTREELFEYFGANYSAEQIEKALYILAEHSSDFEPGATHFPTSITEQLEQIFNVVEAAVDSHTRSLNGAEDCRDLAQIQSDCITIANAQSLRIPDEVFNGMTEILIGEGIAQAAVQHRIVSEVRRHTLSQLQKNDLSDLNQDTALRIAQITTLFSDPKTVDKILADYGLESKDEFGRGLNKLANESTPDFDVDAFLEEKGVENPETKKLTPQTIQDTQAVVRSLIKRNLK